RDGALSQTSALAPTSARELCEPGHAPSPVYSRRDSDKGKAIERWRRKVSGLTGFGPTIAGPPESSPTLGLFTRCPLPWLSQGKCNEGVERCLGSSELSRSPCSSWPP